MILVIYMGLLMLMRGTVPAENYANPNVCDIRIGSTPYSISMFGEIRNDTLQLWQALHIAIN